MTILGGLFARSSIEDPNVPITAGAVNEWAGGARRVRSNVVVNEWTAYGLTAWLRAVSLMAGTMAALPLKVYRTGTRERMTTPPVLQSPNAAQTPFEFWQTMYANALSWGNAYAWKATNQLGLVTSLSSIHPSRVRLVQVAVPTASNDGKEFHVRDAHTGVERKYTSRDIFHIPYLAPSGFVGLSPLTIAAQVLGISIAAEETSAGYYGNGAQLSGILTSKTKLTQPQAEALKSRWREKVRGAHTAGDIAVLDADTAFTPLSVSAADAQLLSSRQFGVVEIARIFGVPPHLLMDVERSTSWGSGIEQQTLGFVKYTLQPWITAVEQRVTRELIPARWYAEYSLDGLLRGDSAAQAQFFHSAVIDGWMSRNEVRTIRNLEPADGLDEFLVPSNLTLISVDGQLQPLGGSNGPSPANTTQDTTPDTPTGDTNA